MTEIKARKNGMTHVKKREGSGSDLGVTFFSSCSWRMRLSADMI